MCASELDPGKFRLSSNATVQAMQRRLRHLATVGTLKELNEVEKLLGFIYHAESWLQDPDLDKDLMSWMSWDWMHIYMSDGVFVLELKALLHVLDRYALGVRAFHQFLQLWQWPHAYATPRGRWERMGVGWGEIGCENGRWRTQCNETCIPCEDLHGSDVR